MAILLLCPLDSALDPELASELAWTRVGKLRSAKSASIKIVTGFDMMQMACAIQGSKLKLTGWEHKVTNGPTNYGKSAGRAQKHAESISRFSTVILRYIDGKIIIVIH